MAKQDEQTTAAEKARKGGRIGGKVRAARLSPERRREIASAAAAKRWSGEAELKRQEERLGAKATALEHRLLMLATRIFADDGFLGANMRQIAKEAKVGLHTIYNLFGDKRALYVKCCIHIQQIYTAMTIGTAEAFADDKERIYAFVYATTHIQADPALPKLIQRQLLDHDMTLVQLLADRMFPNQFEMLRAAIERMAGAERSDFCTLTIYGLIFGLVQLSPYSESSGRDLPTAADPARMTIQILEVVLPGVDWAGIAAKVYPQLDVEQRFRLEKWSEQLAA